MRAEAEMDDLRLAVEQSRHELSATRDEFERFKEKTGRQLLFLESENSQLKKSATEKVERYYEEKKKWQAKFRAAEAAAASALANSSSSAPPPPVATAAATSSSSKATDDKWKLKLEEMEKSVLAKSEEARSAQVRSADLELKIKQLEQQVLSARFDIGGASSSSSSSAGGGDAAEMREMRTRLHEAEGALRRKTREAERLELKLHNQAVLQEENAGLASKVAAMQASVDSAQALTTRHQVLLEEKKTWTTLFRSIVAPSAEGGAGQGEDGDADTTPLAALRQLSSAQQKCTLLLRAQGELEAAKTDLKRQLLRAEADLHDCERGKAEAQFRADTAEDKLRLAQQQNRLYEGEVKSLRAMIKTFDAELSFGRPDTASVVKLKDEAVTAVQQELDACRVQAQSFASRVEELEAKLSASVAEGTELRRANEKQREELFGIKHAAGLDFVPGRTRVLHLQQNPAAAAAAAAGRAPHGPSTVPQERMRALQAENRQLTESLAAASAASSAAAAAAAAAGPSSSLQNTSVAAAGAATSAPDSSKLNLRLKEMFRERITSFREAVYLLLGYKVDLLFANEAGGSALPRLRLRSMYAESPEDSLLFQWRGDTLELMQTPFAERLDHRLLEHLRRCNSVPCFLSNITMELFESQTFQP